MNIAMTGAGGFLGRHLITELKAHGHTVQRLRRHPAEPDPEILASADAIVNLAGEPVTQRWTPEAKRRIRDSRIVGTHNLVVALSKAPRRSRVLISASAIGIYGSRGDEVLTETSSPGEGFLAELATAWEREASRAEEFGMRVVTPRLGVVLGRDGGALQKMVPIFRAGLGGRLASGTQWMSWIHVDDVVHLILFALATPALSGPVNATAPNPATNARFTAALAGALHRPAVFPVPAFLLNILYGEMAGMLIGSQRVLPRSAQEAGYRFRFPELSQAISDVVESRRATLG